VLLVDLVEAVAHLEDLLGLDGDVGGLALRAARGLVDHDPGVGQRAPLTGRPGREEERAHGGGLADAERGDGAADVLHGVVDGEPRGDDAPGAVDVEVDGLERVLGLEEEQLRDDERGRVVGDGPVDADDALLEQAREDVVGALPAGGGLDDHGDQAVLPVRREPLRLLLGRRLVVRGRGEERPRGCRRDEPARAETRGPRAHQAQRAGPGRGPRRGGRERGRRGVVREGESGGGRHGHGRGRVALGRVTDGRGGAGDLRQAVAGGGGRGLGMGRGRTAERGNEL